MDHSCHSILPNYKAPYTKEANLPDPVLNPHWCTDPAYPLLHAGGLFSATAQQGDQLIPLQVTESTHGPRTASARLHLEHAGKWVIRIMHTCTSGPTEDTPTILTSHQVFVEEGSASAACSRLTDFWPAQGAIAGVPAAFTIQVSSLHSCDLCAWL